MAVFERLPARHHDDPVRAEDGVDPVSDGDDGAVVEGRPQDVLNQSVGLKVDVGRGFVHTNNLNENTT